MSQDTVETPTQALVKTTNTATQIDARGRLITVKKLNALQFYNASKALGAASNAGTAADLAMLACAVTKIDALPIAFPSSERDIQFLIQQLDFEGLTAAGEALAKIAEAETASDSVDAAKN